MIYYLHSSSQSRGLCVRSVLTLRKSFYSTCFFPTNEIFQWQFDYLVLWRLKEQFEDSLTFPLFSFDCLLCLSNIPHLIFSVCTKGPRKYLWHRAFFTINPSQCRHNRKKKWLCVFVWFRYVPEWMGFAVDTFDCYALKLSLACILNKAKRIQASVLFVLSVWKNKEEKEIRQRKRGR